MYVKIPKNLKLVVFDIDFTIQNAHSIHMPLHVLNILQFFRKSNVCMVIASLNQCAPAVLQIHKVYHLFHCVEYRPHLSRCKTDDQIDEYFSLKKTQMFQRLSQKYNVKYDEMLFFDDSVLNIVDAKELGIKSVCVNPNNLITWKNVQDGLALFDKRKRRYSQ
mgnify:CR=1 FL=1